MSENKPPEEVQPEDAQNESAEIEGAQAEGAQAENAENQSAQPHEVGASGSRWENAESTPDAGWQPATEPTAVATPPDRSRWLSGKKALIGAGLGVALVAGASGFAIGQVAADGSDHGRFESERRWDGGSEDGRPMFPDERGPGMDRGERPHFGEDDEPGMPDSDSDDSESGTTIG